MPSYKCVSINPYDLDRCKSVSSYTMTCLFGLRKDSLTERFLISELLCHDIGKFYVKIGKLIITVGFLEITGKYQAQIRGHWRTKENSIMPKNSEIKQDRKKHIKRKMQKLRNSRKLKNAREQNNLKDCGEQPSEWPLKNARELKKLREIRKERKFKSARKLKMQDNL